MNKIIGETSYKQTAFGIIPRSQLIPLEVEGIRKAWDFVLQCDNDGKLPLSTAFLKKVHKEGFGWIFPEIGGLFRTIDVSVSQHTPPKSYLVPQLMEDFIKDTSARIHHLPDTRNEMFLDEIVTLLAWAHHRFVWIHPFQDYNGRIGRILSNIILLLLKLPPIELKIETASGRRRYIEALHQADHHSYEKLEVLFKKALIEAVNSIEKGGLK